MSTRSMVLTLTLALGLTFGCQLVQDFFGVDASDAVARVEVRRDELLAEQDLDMDTATEEQVAAATEDAAEQVGAEVGAEASQGVLGRIGAWFGQFDWSEWVVTLLGLSQVVFPRPRAQWLKALLALIPRPGSPIDVAGFATHAVAAVGVVHTATATKVAADEPPAKKRK